MWCHLLLAAPALGLLLFVVLPLPIALPAYGLVVVTSLLIYHKVWQSMKLRPFTGQEALLGAEGYAVSDLGSSGLVQIRGELWTALSDQKLARGSRVHVVGFQGNKVIVRESRPDQSSGTTAHGSATHR